MISKNELIDYIMESPLNTNPAFLNILLKEYKESVLKKETLNVTKIAPYFYSLQYDNVNYEKAKKYLSKYKPAPAACSVAANGSTIGRSFDWLYDEVASFLVYTKATDERHAVLGMARGTAALTDKFVSSGNEHEDYDVVPCLLVDGINDAGLFCESNVTTFDFGNTTGTNPDGEDMCALMLVRYLLDNAASVDEAIALLPNLNIYGLYSRETKEELHFFLKDSEKTAVIEFVDNEIKITDEFLDNHEVMTNFHLYELDLENPPKYSMGLERYKLICDELDNNMTMEDIVESVKYTNAYTIIDPDKVWYSEFNGNWGDYYGDLTVDSVPEDYARVLEKVRKDYANRKRDGVTWQTVHSAIYDLENKTISIKVQEQDEAYEFSFSDFEGE